MNRIPATPSGSYGQYVPGNSILHRLNSAGKLLCFFLLLAAVTASSTAGGYVLLAAVTAGLSLLAGLSLKKLTGSLRGITGFLVVIFLMNAFFTGGSEPIWSWGILRLSSGGMLQGANMVLRVVFLMILGNLLLATTPPQEITMALASFLKPLKLLSIPVNEVAMILSAALQFLPILSREAELIKKAQLARGARFESRNLFHRAASYLPLLIPIFLSAFRRADELALAMEARGYQSGQSGPEMAGPGFHRNDLAALTGSAVICMIQLTCFH